ncbi:hypothetical protein KP509_07G093400 [Ceratopteris richardii]|uniref:Uncharacterized protein n=1 Tax=Ceratopteris richardii TaxID=49495 RepID=A0A8T2UCF4_CERRI|nr:hypothetical protein KP509_07G093400 [Ceratopteris richardii]
MMEPDDFLDTAIPHYRPSVVVRLPPPSPSNEPPPAVRVRIAWVDRFRQFRNRIRQFRNCFRQLMRKGTRLSVVAYGAADSEPLYRRLVSSISSIYDRMARGAQVAQPARPNAREAYERKLGHARWAARLVGLAFILSSFFAVCSLTWATVVLLGAYVSNLVFSDYIAVACLLIFEAIHLASAAFFTILLTHGLARRSQDPEHIIHGRDDHYQRASVARILSSFVQLILVLPSLVWPILRFFRLTEQGVTNLHTSLRIFYILAICNAVSSLMTLVFSTLSFFYLRDRNDQSTLRYYDELTQRAISFGVVRADEFGFFEFAYRMLGSEYARIIQPEAVVKNHRKLIQYLYLHRLGQDFLAIFMDAGDAFIQQAAVNMPGFWADPSKKVGLQKVEITPRVLTKMADKVGHGQVGWAACNSFGALARKDPMFLMQARLSCGMPLLERLAELLVDRSSNTLAHVRTLMLFYHYSYLGKITVPCLVQEKKLAERLKQLLGAAKVLRVRVLAAYLLHLMGHLDVGCYDDVDLIRPGHPDTYWFESEMELFKFIRVQCGMSELPQGYIVDDEFIRKEETGCRYL